LLLTETRWYTKSSLPVPNQASRCSKDLPLLIEAVKSWSYDLQIRLAAAQGEFQLDDELVHQLGGILASGLTRGAERAVLELADPMTKRLLVAQERYASPELETLATREATPVLGVRPVSLLAFRKQTPILLADLPALLARRKARGLRILMDQELAAAVLAVPILVDEAPVGVLSLASSRPRAFGEQARSDLISYAGIAGRMLLRRRQRDPGVSALVLVVQALLAAIQARDEPTAQHLLRVEECAVAIGVELGLSLSDLQTVRYAALLHDLGKIGLADRLLKQDRRLHPREYEEIKRYPGIGAGILAQIPELAAAAEAILHHQEHWDGSGYPDGLKGEAIPLAARIVKVADAYDAITSNRPYRLARGTGFAVREIQKLAGREFCPRVVKVFVSAVGERELGRDESLAALLVSHL